jgi:hypothetical protein
MARVARGCVVLVFLLSAPLGSCTSPMNGPEVWFAPNLGSPDMIDLFTQPLQWHAARRATSVFKFYERALLADTPAACPECGRNILPELVRVDAFNRLNSWGISIGIEVGALKSWGCAASATLPPTLDAMQRVEAHQAVVSVLAMDEPILGGQACGLTLDESAVHAARFALQARAGRPHVRVGDIEAYPIASVPTLIAWLAALRANGFTPAFFHLDVDRTHVARIGADVAGDLRTLRSAVETEGIPFGVIFASEVGTSDAAYTADVRSWVETVRGAMGQPTHSIFQSWAVSPDGGLRVPANLPEADASLETHTRLVNDGLADFRSGPSPGQR